MQKTQRRHRVGWVVFVCIGMLAAACSQLPDAKSSVGVDPKAAVTVTIDPELALAFVKKNPQFQLKTLAQTVEKS